MEYFDKHGIPIHKGDLLRSPHFIGPRRKQYYLYHVVVQEPDGLFLVPASHLEPTMRNGGGRCPLNLYSDTWASEIVSGYGPDPYLSYDERPRRKRD
jgi:hypothetical protein